MTAARLCLQCGQAKPIKYRAIYASDEGRATDYLVICEDCGREMTPDTFTTLAVAALPQTDGRIEIVNTPAEEATQEEQLPENQ